MVFCSYPGIVNSYIGNSIYMKVILTKKNLLLSLLFNIQNFNLQKFLEIWKKWNFLNFYDFYALKNRKQKAFFHSSRHEQPPLSSQHTILNRWFKKLIQNCATVCNFTAFQKSWVRQISNWFVNTLMPASYNTWRHHVATEWRTEEH